MAVKDEREHFSRCYDDGEEFQTICKLELAFSEIDLETLSKALEPHF